MDIFIAIIIGIVQGLTEFLPVSSSAHLVFVQTFFGLTQNNMAFDVLLHIGTLVAVVGYFFSDIIKMIKGFFLSIVDIFKGNFKNGLKNDPYKKLAWLVILATIPIGIVGVLFNDIIESLFTGVTIPAAFLLVTGTLLYFSQRYNTGNINLENISAKEALIMGVGQACAILPGLSRSGTTIASGYLAGLDKEFAARFSFILSIPAILGASIVEFHGIGSSFMVNFWPSILGFLAAVIAGLFAIKVLLKLIQERSLDIFAFYCWIVGAIILISSLFLH